jgi:hypothetical protein
MKKDALCLESIAMENPAWVPEIELPIIQAQCVATRETAWNVLNVNIDANEMTNVLRHRKVTLGERQALCAQQNQRFQDKCVKRPSSPLHEDEDAMPPKLPKEHLLDDSCMFLTSLFLI